MRPTHQVFLAFLVARLVFGVVFLASALGRWPVPWYFPLQHRWEVARRVSGLAMDWYGRSLVALLAGVAAGALAYGIARFPSAARLFARRGFVAAVAHLGAVMLMQDVLFYVFTLATRHVTPAALPAWYCPR